MNIQYEGWDVLKEVIRGHDIDPEIVAALITQESNWDPWVARYEPTYSYLYKPDEFAKKNKITRLTEECLQKVSFGLGQIMGAVAREMGHEDSLLKMSDPKINVDIMCKYLNRLENSSKSTDDIIAMYNGGKGALQKVDGKYKNQSYVDSVNNHLKKIIS
jgi:soluble lytic murein transglycosylase-like protein